VTGETNLIRPATLRQLPRTGQTAVSQAGDDGTYQAGMPLTAAQRFVDRGDGTVLDLAFHPPLQWVKQPELIIPGATGVHATNQIQAARGNWANATAYAAADLAKDTVGSTYWVCAVAHTSAAGPTTFAEDRAAHPTYWRETIWTASAANLTTPATMAWAAAIVNCVGLAYAGYDDWRLPNLLELWSLIRLNAAVGTNAIAVAFPNPQSQYTSSSTYHQNALYSPIIQYYYDQTAVQLKTSNYYVRPVRGGRVIA